MSSPTRRATRLLSQLVVPCVAAALTLGYAPAPAYADWIRSAEWQLTTLHVRAAWSYSTGSGVIVAVLDSGVDASHPDLAGQVMPGADFVDGSTDGRRDFVGHGTTVAALIAGRNDDSSGVAGVAPRAKILPVRVLDKDNKYKDAATVAKGLRWAVDHGASVVNMSLGGPVRSAELASAITYAYAHDVVVVACTGNQVDGTPTSVWYPAREPGVVAVGGLIQTGTGVAHWPEALSGTQTVLTAPAVNMLGAKPGGYWKVQGTSFAAPLVAGTAALVRAQWPELDAANVINRLISTADDLGPSGRDPTYGYGEVDPQAALTATVPTVSANPLLASRPTPNESTAAKASGDGGPLPTGSLRAAALGDAAAGWPQPLGSQVIAAVAASLMTIVAGLIWRRRRRSAPTG